ncbi:MAG: hypothetical protein D6B28_05255 [Gammaproteobacteria bacterium]|nr:MAG: hypothetical protein D6B28_05255 [Gammaproteobacteria bacterium]
MSNIDQIYASSYEEVESFKFDEAVTAVFPDMINRSVPGYQVVVQMRGVLAKIDNAESSSNAGFLKLDFLRVTPGFNTAILFLW